MGRSILWETAKFEGPTLSALLDLHLPLRSGDLIVQLPSFGTWIDFGTSSSMTPQAISDALKWPGASQLQLAGKSWGRRGVDM